MRLPSAPSGIELMLSLVLQHASTLGCDDINTYLEKIEGEKLLKNLTGGWGPRWPLGNLPQPQPAT